MEETKETTKKTTTTKKAAPKSAAKKTTAKKTTTKAKAASMITWLYPILGIAVAIPGLSMGIVTHETRRSNYSLLGIVMSLVGIILSIIKAFSV